MNLNETAYEMPTGVLLHEAGKQFAMAEIVYDAQRKAFNEGAVAILGAICAFDSEVAWAYAVRTVSAEELVRHAYHNEGDWQWAGFEKYARRNFGNGNVSAWVRKGPLPYGVAGPEHQTVFPPESKPE